MSNLQEIFDSFDLAAKGEIVSDAGLSAQVLSAQLDVRIDPEAILAAILKRRRLTNEEFGEIMREHNIALTKPNPPEQVSLAFRFYDDPGDHLVPLHHLTASSVMVCDVSGQVAALLASVSGTNEMPAPPTVRNVEPGSTLIDMQSVGAIISCVGYVFHLANAVMAQASPEALNRLMTIGSLAGAAIVIERATKWRKEWYEGSKARIEMKAGKRDLAEPKPEPAAVAQTQPTQPTIIQNFIIVGQGDGLSPAVMRQLGDEVVPSAIAMGMAAGQPTIVVSNSSSNSAKAGGASASASA